MPLDIAMPTWYNDDSYINEKVDECNTIKFGAVEGEEFTPWTADSVRDFMAGVNNEASYSPWMGYDNFVESGNAENCSPNPLFNVMQYVAAKANQLNSLNDGAGYGDHANNWTAQLVLDYFNAHDITAWDHFTTAGQFEGVNPSNAMDLSEFLTKKAAQCNEMKFDNREDWDEQAVLDYYQQHGLNAVMVAVSDSDPNVVAVPEADQVTPPVGITPWGMATMPVDVELTTGVDVMPSNDAPINYVGTVANFNSTLNPNDQISGGNGNDKLTVNMDGSWGGFENGFVKDVPTVNLVNGSEGDTPFTWNAEGTTGVDNYEIDGYVNLENLPQTGITVDYSNINNRGAGNALINFASTGASDDALNINLGKNVGWLNFQTSGVETITLNSNESAASLNTYADGMNNLVLKGDAVYNIRTMTLTTKSLDMSDLTSDGNFVCLSRSEGVNSIIGGSGNDSVSVRNLTPNAVIDGGDGEDSVKLRSSVGSFQWDMKNVETLNVAMAANLDIEEEPNANPAQAIFLDGSNTTGLKTFGIAGGNGYAFESGAQTDKARPIYFTNYKMDQVDVKVTGKNFVDLNIDTIKNVTVNVGDGTANNGDLINGSVTLLDATALTINTTDNNAIATPSTPFQAEVYAAKANNLTLGTSQGSEIEITGGDLSAVSNVAVSGYSDVTIDEAAALGANAGSLRITNTQIGGVFTADLAGNSAGNSSLTYSGSSTNQVNLTLDQNYSSVNITTGVRDDVLTLTVDPNGQISSGTLKGTLGEGNDTVIVNSSTGSWDKASLDFSGLAGVEKIQLNGLTTQDARALVANGSIKLAEGMTAGEVYGDSFAPSDAEIGPGVNYGNGGETTFKGPLDTSEDVTINGDSATGDAGGAFVNFGTGKDDLNIKNVGSLTINGGSDTNSITGTPTNITGDFIVNDVKGTADDTINLTGISATGAVNIQAPEAGVTKFDVSVANAASATLNAGNTANATMSVAGVDGGVSLTAGDNGSTMSVTATSKVQPDSISMKAGAGNDTVTLTGIKAADEGTNPVLSVDLGDGKNSLTVSDGTDLTGWKTSITGANITLAGKANLGDLSGITDSTISGGTLQLSGDLDLTKSSLNITSGVDIADGKTLTVGQGFAPEGAITGDGTLAVAGGTAEATVDLSAVKVAADVALVINEGATVQVGANFGDASKAVGSKAISGDGTLEFKADATAFEIGSTISTNIKVDEGATLTLGGGWDGSYAKVISGPGAVQNGDGKAWDLIGDNALGFIGDNLTLNVVTGGTGIKLGEVEATNVFKVSGDGNVTVDLSGGTGETANLTGITANTSSSFTGTFNVSMDQKDSVTLSDNAAEVITIAGSDLTGFDSADDALTVYGFGTGDTVKLAGALTGIAFDSTKGAAADATTPVTVVDDKIYVLTGFEGDVTTTTLGDIFGNAKAFKYASSDADIVLAVAGDDSTSLYSVATSTSAVTDVQLIGIFNGMNVTVADAGNIFVS